MYELGLHIRGSMYELGKARIRILEGQLEMERHPENHTLESAAILHEIYNGMGNPNMELFLLLVTHLTSVFYSCGVFSELVLLNLNLAVYSSWGTEPRMWIDSMVVKELMRGDWGGEGYFKIQSDIDAKEGMCGIAMMASYPTV
ncbi:cysteine peptidase, asparagine active site-containing protein [Tanacetum coccineum]